MNIITWTSFGFAIIAILLFFIFAKKNLQLHRKISSAFILPFTALFFIFTMLPYRPDSIHIITISAIVYAFCTVSIILFYFDEKLLCRIFARTLFLLSVILWIGLFKSTFYIYRVSIPVFIISTLIYLGFILFIFIYLGKQKIAHYFWTVVSLLICTSLHFCSVVTLIAGHNLYSVFLFLGTTSILLLNIYYLLSFKKGLGATSRLLQIVLLITSQILISISCYLMIS